MNLACTSKRNNNFVPHATTYGDHAPGTITRVLHMSPSTLDRYEGTDGERFRLSQLANQLQLRINKNPNLRDQYRHASMKDYHAFQFLFCGGRPSSDEFRALENEFLANGPRIEGITSLDFCFSTQQKIPMSVDAAWVLRTLSSLFTSLRQVDFSNNGVSNVIVQSFFKNCPLLGKLTVNNTVFSSCGYELSAAYNLKELHMDDALIMISESKFDAYSNLDTENEVVSNQFLLHECSSKVLERVSMRNAKMCHRTATPLIPAIPQKALMKFILNAPTTLRWFRSNLTPENIEILHKERPEIELVS